jgi:phosphohistidine phosphatase
MSERRLVLIRHAKAADGTVDAERPLTGRGRRDAAAIGAWLDKATVTPDRAVVSSARRAVETWKRAAEALATAAQVVDERLYDNTVDALLAVIRDTPPDVQTLAVIGHNPSIERLANDLDDELGDSASRAELAGGYPTSGVAVFTLNTPFAELEPKSATLTHFATPRG